MEPRISSLIDPALLTEDPSSRTIFNLSQVPSELPFDAVRPPRFIRTASRPEATLPTKPQDAVIKENTVLLKQRNASSKLPASSIPLAEVLNSENDVAIVKESLSFMLQDSSSRRKRKVDGNERLKLPQLPAPAKKIRRPRIPPLLPGLYEPPPDAGLFPAITTDAPAAPAPPPPPPPAPLPETIPSILEESKKDAENITQVDEPKIVEEKGDSGFMVLEFPGLGKVVKKGPKKPKTDQKRRRWTDEETNALLKGVAQFGIGNWTTILTFHTSAFNNRSAQDLKDRFRICCPDQYRNSTQPRGAASASLREPVEQQNEVVDLPSDSEAASAQALAQVTKRKSHRKGPEELANLGIQEPFKKSNRRQRRAYSKDEDDALLKGFLKHGAQWQKIREDQELKLSDRKSNDLRDHFRNTHPDKYAEAGFKLHGELLAKHQDQNNPNKNSKADSVAPKPTTSATTKDAAQNSLRMPPLGTSSFASKNRANHHKPLDPFLDAFDDEFFGLDADDFVDPTPLNRTILDWADQNVPHAAPIAEGLPSILHISQLSKATELPSLTHIDPSATLKPPRAPASKPGASYIPSAPLSGIITDSNVKNNTFSLPPAADLMIGLEPENQTGGLWGAELRRLFEQ